MEPLTWILVKPGRYTADNPIHTRRYTITRTAPKKWTLTVWKLREHVFTYGDNLYLTDGDTPEHRFLHDDTKWEAVAHANMWEAEKTGDHEAKTTFHNQMVDRWIGNDIPEDLANELRERLYN